MGEGKFEGEEEKTPHLCGGVTSFTWKLLL